MAAPPQICLGLVLEGLLTPGPTTNYPLSKSAPETMPRLMRSGPKSSRRGRGSSVVIESSDASRPHALRRAAVHDETRTRALTGCLADTCAVRPADSLDGPLREDC
ncbi:hypothetical protein FA95DRAFT_1555365 [Auriscalpium vulgare]|uniref:Uncharacterized protein n=1 Tax=Auriscalpium vulgare TaxID=40419 RepID=A0ACB8S271_9AGAM|nr:hypothetical protein FA95DRAFT_1555365 [Auriscalpium vulgare]